MKPTNLIEARKNALEPRSWNQGETHFRAVGKPIPLSVIMFRMLQDTLVQTDLSEECQAVPRHNDRHEKNAEENK